MVRVERNEGEYAFGHFDFRGTQVALCDDRACERESPVTTTLDPGESFRTIGHNFRITREDGTTLGCIHSGGGTTRAVSDARECGVSGSVGAMPASAPSRRVR